jgi:thioredoxin 1
MRRAALSYAKSLVRVGASSYPMRSMVLSNVNRNGIRFLSSQQRSIDDIHEADRLDKVLKGNKAVAIDFYTEWCAPCRMMTPVFTDMSSRFPDITFVKVDLDAPGMEEVSTRFGVSSVPYFAAFYEGREIKSMVGADRSKLQELLQFLGDKSQDKMESKSESEEMKAKEEGPSSSGGAINATEEKTKTESVSRAAEFSEDTSSLNSENKEAQESQLDSMAGIGSLSSQRKMNLDLNSFGTTSNFSASGPVVSEEVSGGSGGSFSSEPTMRQQQKERKGDLNFSENKMPSSNTVLSGSDAARSEERASSSASAFSDKPLEHKSDVIQHAEEAELMTTSKESRLMEAEHPLHHQSNAFRVEQESSLEKKSNKSKPSSSQMRSSDKSKTDSSNADFSEESHGMSSETRKLQEQQLKAEKTFEKEAKSSDKKSSKSKSSAPFSTFPQKKERKKY